MEVLETILMRHVTDAAAVAVGLVMEQEGLSGNVEGVMVKER